MSDFLALYLIMIVIGRDSSFPLPWESGRQALTVAALEYIFRGSWSYSTCILLSLLQGHYVVAVIKKSDPSLTWYSLQGKKSCHPAVGTSAGWIIPMGLIYNKTGSCKFGKCVLGGDVASPFLAPMPV